MVNNYTQPDRDEIEVSIFGPGYGEAIALHLGESKWILVDSCIDPHTKKPASLQYLQEIGVNLEKEIELVVVTHWHDDHIRGISEIFSQCQNARLSISSALNNNDFLTLVELFDEPAIKDTSGIKEFIQLFRCLESRKLVGARFSPPIFSLADRLLISIPIQLNDKKVFANVYALSPSDAALLQSQLAFAQTIMGQERARHIISPSPNHASVVIWVEIAEHKILLGADLENTSDPNSGWEVILNTSKTASGKANFYKVPHHGAASAHNENVWHQLLEHQPFAALTPFQRGRVILPTSTDAERLKALTPNAYITAQIRKSKAPQIKNKIVREFVMEATRKIRDVNYGWGHIRVRKKIASDDIGWQVDLFGDAYHLVGNIKKEDNGL